MKKILTTISFVLLLFSTSLWTITASAEQQTDYLFIQQAKEGKLVATQDKNTYKLVVKGLDSYIMYFSDRPVRTAGLIPTPDFYKQWNEKVASGFQSDAPNAGLVGVKLHKLKEGKDSEVAITLSNPQYDAAHNTVTYTAKILTADLPKLPKAMGFSHLVLFFDGGPYCPSCS